MRHLYQRFFTGLPIRFIDSDERLDILTDDEAYMIRETEKAAYFYCIVIELGSYLLTFLPIYALGDALQGHSLTLGGPFAGALDVSGWLPKLWSILVSLTELYVLLLMNLAAVHGIAVATGYVRRAHPGAHVRDLVRIAMEQKFGGQQAYGINPFQGLNHWLLYLYLLINRIKGLLGNLALRAILSYMFGTHILRVVMDFSGMPIYMIINLYTTRVILRNTRVAVMGQAAVERFVARLPTLTLTDDERELIYDSLQFIAINKRDYHLNHYHLTRQVLRHLAIPAERDHPLRPGFASRLAAARPTVADLCRSIIVAGFVLDGRISWQERRHLHALRAEGVLDVADGELQGYCRDFVGGRSLTALTARWLPRNTG